MTGHNTPPKLLREIDRLLAVLASPGVKITPDGEARWLVSLRQGKVSVSRGAFSQAAFQTLAAQGCINWQEKPCLCAKITGAGLMRLRRNTPPPAGAAEIDPFLRQHLDLAVSNPLEPENSPIVTDEAESPLAWLARRKGRDGRALISPVQFQAGERLRSELTMSAILPRTTANWQAVGVQSGYAGLNHSEMVTAARQRVQKALTAVGPEFSGLLTDICGFLKGLEQIERDRDWPARSGKVVLGLALDRLAAHYGLHEQATGPASAKIRQWGAGDYRPRISQR